MAVVKSQAERKMVVYNIESGAPITSGGLLADPLGNTLNGYLTRFIMANINLQQGVAQNNRIGNSISNAKLVLRGCITALPVDSPTNFNQNPFEVHNRPYIVKTFDVFHSPIGWLNTSAR